MARPTKQARKRTWAPKAKSGCKTCKIRRKRCDETKPFCVRCIRGRYTCDGYEPCTQRFQQYTQKTRSTSTSPPAKHEQLIDARLPITNASPTVADFLQEPSNHLSAAIDHRYSRFFNRIVAPLLSTTRQWHSFWLSIVPQASWDNHCLHHAMVALAATYEAKTVNIDRGDLIMSRVNLAIREFSTQPVSPDIALIFCRLLSSMAKSTGDWKSAMLHLRSGGNILKEAARNYQAPSEIAKLLAPAFLCITTSIDVDSDTVINVAKSKRRQFLDLKILYTKYGDILRSLNREQWLLVEGALRSCILISWSIMTQALASIAHPDVLELNPTNVLRSPAQVKDHLFDSGQLLSLPSLKAISQILFEDLCSYFAQLDFRTIVPQNLKHRLQYFAENFLVQAAEIQPNITTGTFWPEGAEAMCSITCMVQQNKNTTSATDLPGLDSFEEAVCGLTASSDHLSITESQQWYLEYVCPYRSGFIPAFLGPSFALASGE